MQITWTKDFSVGIEEIDSQHRELFNRINNLDAALRQGKVKEEILRVINFLDEYAVTHFGTEEKYMVAYDYPDYRHHREKHEWFRREFSGIKNKLGNGTSLADIIGLSNHLLIDWFCNHIRTADMSLGGFLKSKLRQHDPSDPRVD